jgi:hypothetical protein
METEKEIKFLKKLKTRFTSDLEFVGAMMEMVDDGIITQDSFMTLMREIVSKKGIAKTTASTGGCR